MSRHVNPRRLTGRPRRSLAKWIERRPPVPRQTVTPGCWWAIGGALLLVALAVYLLLRWLV